MRRGQAGPAAGAARSDPPPVAELMEATLAQLRAGVTDSDAMRAGIAAAHGIQRDTPVWARFVNNHAWALVRLQAAGRIAKRGEKLHALLVAQPPEPEPFEPIRRGVALPSWAKRTLQAKNHLNLKKWPKTRALLREDDIRSLWEQCNGCCSLTGLPFSNEPCGSGAAKRAFAPSIDRIDLTKPYTRANCRFVLVAVNFALNAFGDEVFDRIVEARCERKAQPR